MNCKEARSQIESFLGGDLPSAQQERLKKHLRSCKSCCEEFSGTVRLLSSLRKGFQQYSITLSLPSQPFVVSKSSPLPAGIHRAGFRFAPLIIFIVLILFLTLAIPSSLRLMSEAQRTAGIPSTYSGGIALTSWSSLLTLQADKGAEVGWRVSFY